MLSDNRMELIVQVLNVMYGMTARIMDAIRSGVIRFSMSVPRGINCIISVNVVGVSERCVHGIFSVINVGMHIRDVCIVNLQVGGVIHVGVRGVDVRRIVGSGMLQFIVCVIGVDGRAVVFVNSVLYVEMVFRFGRVSFVVMEVCGGVLHSVIRTRTR